MRILLSLPFFPPPSCPFQTISSPFSSFLLVPLRLLSSLAAPTHDRQISLQPPLFFIFQIVSVLTFLSFPGTLICVGFWTYRCLPTFLFLLLLFLLFCSPCSFSAFWFFFFFIFFIFTFFFLRSTSISSTLNYHHVLFFSYCLLVLLAHTCILRNCIRKSIRRAQ